MYSLLEVGGQNHMLSSITDDLTTQNPTDPIRKLRGLGAEVARKFAAEGSHIAINYVSSEAPAQALSQEIAETYHVKTTIVQGDGGIVADVQNCVRHTIEVLGGLDIIIGNHGWTKFSTFADLDALSYEEWDKAWRANVVGMHALLKEALPTFNANPDGGVFILTSSVAGVSLAGSSMAYSVTKAAQLHLMKCLANTQGAKVRVNAVLPGLLLTDWGNQYGEERLAGIKKAAVLKKEVRSRSRVDVDSHSVVLTEASLGQTEIADCADAYVMIAKNSSLTGQNIQVGESNCAAAFSIRADVC